jgi:hypothetical protein
MKAWMVAGRGGQESAVNVLYSTLILFLVRAKFYSK